MQCSADADNTFGPQYCNQFDFTLLFEQTIFQTAPCALLILTLPPRAFQLRRRKVKTSRDRARAVKGIAIAVLAATQLALLIAWSAIPTIRTKASIPAAVLSFMAALSLLYLSNVEHMKSVRPSSTIGLYTLFSFLLDIPQVRSLWLRSNSRALPVIFTVGMLAKTIVLYVETRNKRRSLLPPYRFYAPEVLVSIYDRVALWWLNPLFLQGYRSVISFNDLFSIDSELSSGQSEETFYNLWSKREYLPNTSLFLTSLTIFRAFVVKTTPCSCNNSKCVANHPWYCCSTPLFECSQVIAAAFDAADYVVTKQ
jgi:ATP-binding cassette subfamily C (CFTR/MRP) protein 1